SPADGQSETAAVPAGATAVDGGGGRAPRHHLVRHCRGARRAPEPARVGGGPHAAPAGISPGPLAPPRNAGRSGGSLPAMRGGQVGTRWHVRLTEPGTGDRFRRNL